jgi:hypothetical protein
MGKETGGSALRELLASFGIEVDTSKLEAANHKVNEFTERLEKVGKAVAGAFLIKEAYEFIEGVAHAIHQVEATSAALGITTQATQEFGYAASAAGMETGELLNMMGRLQVTAASPAGAKAFNAIGVSAKDASGHIKSADVLLEDVAEGIKRIDDPAKRAAAAVGLFGRQGRVLLPFLIKGKAGIEAMRKEFAELGGGFDEEAIEKSAEFEHAMAKIRVVVNGLEGAMVKGLFPVLGWIADKAAAIGGWFVKMTKNTNAVRNALILLGAALLPLAVQMAIAFAPILLAAAAVAALYLVFDDLVTMFEGGQSVIGETLDKVFGKGTSVEVVKQFKTAWEQVRDVFSEIAEIIKPIWGFIKDVAKKSADLGNGIGESLAKYGIAHKEENAEPTGRGGLTDEQNTVAMNAKAYLNAQNRGEDMTKWTPPTIPKGRTKESVMAGIETWIPKIQSEPAYARFQPQTYGPSPGPGMGGDNITVQIAGTTGMKEHEVKRAVADGVLEARQQHNRAAKYAVSQAGQKP